MQLSTLRANSVFFGVTISGDGFTGSLTLADGFQKLSVPGSGTVSLATAHTLTITGANATLSGTTSLPTLTLSVPVTAASGNGIYLNGSTVTLSATSSESFGAIVVAGSGSFGGSMIVVGGGTLTTGGAFTIAGAITQNGTSSNTLTGPIIENSTQGSTFAGSATFTTPYTSPSGLIGLYTFNSNASDSSGQGNNGTLTGSPTFVAGQVGSAISLNGSTQYVELPLAPFNFTSGNFTVATWVKLNSLSGDPVIFGTGPFDTSGYYLQFQSTGEIRLVTNQSGADQITKTATGAATTGTFFHLAITRSGSSVTIYKNGADVTSSHATHTNPTVSASHCYIGQYPGGSFNVNGLVDDFRIFNAALSAGDISTLYTAGFAYAVTVDSATGSIQLNGTLTNTGVTILNGNVTIGTSATIAANGTGAHSIGSVTLQQGTVTATQIKDSGLTAGRITMAGTAGLLQDTTLNATGSTLGLTVLLFNGTANGTESTVTLGPTTLTNGVAANVGSLSLGPALWMLAGVVEFTATTASTLDFKCGSGLTTATFDGLGTYLNQPLIATGLTDAVDQVVPLRRLDFRTASSATPVFIVASSAFTLGTVVANAFVRAVVVG